METKTTTVNRKTLRGVVVSDKMQETATVAVSRYVKHPKYKKYMKQTKKYHVHNPGNRAKEGEQVVIRSCRPLSKTKSFEIIFAN
jgi:small subunit ribosomal protein S17